MYYIAVIPSASEGFLNYLRIEGVPHSGALIRDDKERVDLNLVRLGSLKFHAEPRWVNHGWVNHVSRANLLNLVIPPHVPKNH